jgi:hypothetical protein
MTLHQDELLSNIAEGCVVVKRRGIFGIEGLTHVEPVEPHLRGIDLLVPEASVRRPWLLFQLLTQQSGRLLVLFLFGVLVKSKESSAGENIIEVVILQLVGANSTVGIYKVVHALLHKLEILLLIRA